MATENKLKDALKSLEEMGLVLIDKKNEFAFKLTKKGCDEVMRWKGKNLEMDILLFGFSNLKEKLKRGELKSAQED